MVFVSSFIHYETTDPQTAELFRKAIAVFDGNVPSFHIELFDKPVMVWDFHSLLSVIHLVLGLLITNADQPLRSCKYCNRAFVAEHSKAEFCNSNCKNKYHIYKKNKKATE